ncbi:MAG: P-loop NTPase [Succinivibrionaceae bacterium]|nr:P-loop NTPase [Ruminobacter sp.]MDY5778404.1 P-loop NTPase [Succinivibrionaceae bacterium]MEE1341075.1 P-loop NTPase [Succinivibrionaceae bacterium]
MDQAQGLRTRLKNNAIKVIAVTGGKGGVGKSNVSLNLAVSLCQQGKRVLLLDADLGLANIDVMLGLRVTKNLSHVLSGECTLDEVMVEGPHGLKVVPATSGTQSMVELTQAQHAGLIRAFSELKTPIDVLIVDTAAGISDMVLAFARASQDVLVVVCDEPTSVTDAYALMKILNYDYGVYKFKIIANMVTSLKQGQELFAKLTKVTDRFLDAQLELVSCVPFDNNIRLSVRKRQVIVDAFPRSPAALAFKALALRVNTWPIPHRPEGHLEFFIENLVKRSVETPDDLEKQSA